MNEKRFKMPDSNGVKEKGVELILLVEDQISILIIDSEMSEEIFLEQVFVCEKLAEKVWKFLTENNEGFKKEDWFTELYEFVVSLEQHLIDRFLYFADADLESPTWDRSTKAKMKQKEGFLERYKQRFSIYGDQELVEDITATIMAIDFKMKER